SSSPLRQARTSRSSGQEFFLFSSAAGFGAADIPGTGLLNIKLFRVPQGVVVENGGLQIGDVLPRADQDIGTGHTNDGKLLGGDFLHSVVELLAPLEIQGSELLAHEGINLAFPRRGGLAFA